ncbi:sarcoplasmic reticulum histidine-rich calcium-binding protein-like [Atheta coriaria]|uniref:sarcoplasmic reticulum histidine-rich calcium-binding protein-like n=1 Tax=Dalotia coriaria TaxID=877792 RepID=UPI0031F35B78
METVFKVFVFVAAVLRILDAAQPRPSGFITDLSKGEPLGQYAKLLQPPLAFAYNHEPKTAESVIKQRRLKPDPPAELRKLNSKRILIPKKYLKETNQETIQPEKEKEFLIYVPDEPLKQDSLAAPIIVPELSEEQVAETNTEIKNQPKSDQHVEESHHKKHKPKPVNTKFKAGGEKTDHHEHHEESKKKGDKGYKGEHVKHKVEKAHHVENEKSGHHEDKGGDEKKFDKGEDYQAASHEEDGGKKGSKYEEEGENDKGHATKGTHNVRKKDEYVKKIEFFDEYHEDSDEDEDGGHEDEKDFKKGHHAHKEHDDSAYKHDDYGDYKSHEDSHEKKVSKGKHIADGHGAHHDHDNKHGKKSNHESKKIWKIIVTDKSK